MKEEMKQFTEPTRQKIDVHCHLFNKRVTSISLLFDLIKSIRTKEEDQVTAGEKSSSFRERLKRIVRLLKLLFSKNDDTLAEYLLKYEPDTILVPLMFDLHYAVASKDALQMLSEMNTELKEQLETFMADKNTSEVIPDDGLSELDALHEEINRFIVEHENACTDLSICSSKEDTFDTQYRQILKLKAKYGPILQPFFAVDPRRSGIYQQMRDAIEKDGFAGVKMYCPNGYSPLDPRLDNVYRYCLDNNIPITGHCSYGGFATLENKIEVRGFIYKDHQVVEYTGTLSFTKKIIQRGGVEERALALNHPDLWNMVLERYKGLKLNLAHMGIRQSNDLKKRFEWSELITQMMLRHENLYTDFSCMTEEDAIIYLWNMACKADQKYDGQWKITDRIMFGTDFWLNMLTKDMDQYLKSFHTVFSEKSEDLIRIQTINPCRFLGLTD